MTDIRISTKSKAITKLPPTKKGLKKIRSRIKRELEERKRERKANLERECGKISLHTNKKAELSDYLQ